MLDRQLRDGPTHRVDGRVGDDEQRVRAVRPKPVDSRRQFGWITHLGQRRGEPERGRGLQRPVLDEAVRAVAARAEKAETPDRGRDLLQDFGLLCDGFVVGHREPRHVPAGAGVALRPARRDRVEAGRRRHDRDFARRGDGRRCGGAPPIATMTSTGAFRSPSTTPPRLSIRPSPPCSTQRIVWLSTHPNRANSAATVSRAFIIRAF